MQRQGDGDPKTEDPISYSSSVKKARLQSMLSALLDDPILSDVPKKSSLSDIQTLISLEMGSAMKISILKLDASSFGTFTSPNVALLCLDVCVKLVLRQIPFLP